MCVRISFVGILMINLAITSHCAVKTFRHDNDIFNPKNWVDGRPQENCEGLVFPEVSYSPFLIDELKIDSWVLSEDGQIIFAEEAKVDFNSESEMNCVELKSKDPYFWTDSNNWDTVGKEENYAIPHIERLPCEYDDVVFPRGNLSGTVYYFGEGVKIRSLRFGNDSWTNEVLKNEYASMAIRSTIVTLQDLRDSFFVTNRRCDDVSGCICGNAAAYEDVCDFVPTEDNFRCTDPVTPIGFCQPICGASIVVIPPRNFELAEMEKTLKQFTSDTYISKVQNDSGNEFVQIIFAEKEFTGNSLDEANQLYERIKLDFSSSHVTLYASGPYNNSEEYVNNAVSIVFGTLCGIALVFVILFFMYSPNGTAIILRNRLNIGSRHLPSFKTAYFTRHSSVAEDAGLIFEGQSMASSLLSLDKSFDNPMFGKDEKSTPSTSSPHNDMVNEDAVNTGDDSNHLESEAEMKESISDIKQKDFDNISEGELVDLSDM